KRDLVPRPTGEVSVRVRVELRLGELLVVPDVDRRRHRASLTNWVLRHGRSRGKHGFPRGKAERAGFEPATHLSARTRFPVALLRPLGHLSVLRSGEGGIRTLDGGIHPHN